MQTFDDKNEVKVEYKTLKFGEIGDWFEGTLVANDRKMKNDLSERGELQTVFAFKSIGGSLHLINNKVVDKEATKIPKGEEWSLITGKPAMLNRLKKADLGQKIGLKFTDLVPAKKKGFNDTKIIRVYLGDPDPDYAPEDGFGGF